MIFIRYAQKWKIGKPTILKFKAKESKQNNLKTAKGT
jgi:hypothetical protein